MCGCPLSCPGARTLGPAWRLVATALLLATPVPCVGRNRSVSSPCFGSHKTANPRTLSCARSANVAHCSEYASCTGYAIMKGAARARRRRVGDARCVSPSSPSTGRHTNRDRAKDGRRLDLRTRRENLGRAERRPDARDVRRPRLVRRPRNNVLDLDVCWARRRIDNLIGDVVRHHRYQIVVD